MMGRGGVAAQATIIGRPRRGPGYAVFLAAIVALVPAPTHACACCAETGQRLETSGVMRDYERAELDRANFGATAQLFASVAFPDDVKGVASPSEKPYALRSSMADGRIVFDLVDPQGKAGQIALPLPQRLTRFEVDPRDDAHKDRGLGPTLYKEWRLDGEVRLNGVFAAGGNRAKARLILHGYGNSCTDIHGFTHWTLVVAGQGIRFSLLGALGDRAPLADKKP